MAKVDANKALGINKDGYAKGGIDIETPSQNLEWDPRSKTNANGIQRNVIPTGDKVDIKAGGINFIRINSFLGSFL